MLVCLASWFSGTIGLMYKYLLRNILTVTGLIIDAFGELRDQLEQVKEDMEVSLHNSIHLVIFYTCIFWPTLSRSVRLLIAPDYETYTSILSWFVNISLNKT